MYLRIFEYLQGTQAQNAGIPRLFQVPGSRGERNKIRSNTLKPKAQPKRVRATLAKLPSVLPLGRWLELSFLTPFPLLRAP